jgi:ATP-dependent helicase/DNAse subunit B
MLAHCVYEHFGKHRLRIEALEPPVLDQLVLGSVMHHALRTLGQRRFDAAAIEPAVNDAWNALVPRAIGVTASAQFEREMLVCNIEALIAAEIERAALLPSRASHFELGFGLATDGRDPASLDRGIVLELPPSAGIPETVLRGSIDRVDVVERGRRQYGVAIDYKSGKGESHFKEMQELADFQMPIYCLALPLFDITPVGALYLGVSSGERYGVIRSDFADDFLTDADDRRRIKRLEPDAFAEYMETRQQALRSELARASSGVLTIKPREDTCGYCDLRPVCRIGTFGVGSATGGE